MEEEDPLADSNGGLTAISLADEALGSMKDSELFCTGKVRFKMAQEKSKLSGLPVVKHKNGKVDLGAVLDDPSAREFVCPYCSYSFAYKHVLERHISQIHEKHLLPTLQCPKCTYTTVRKDQMRSHFSVVHEDFKPYFCSECNFRAPKAFRVNAHINKNHGGLGTVIHDTNMRPKPVSPPPFQGLQTEQESAEKEETGLEGEMKNISNEEIPPDEEMKNLSKEETPPDEETKTCFHCPYCDFEADSQINMGDHVVLNHAKDHITRNSQPPQAKECTVCHKKLSNLHKLQDHMRLEHMPDKMVDL